MKKILQLSVLLLATISFGQTPIYNFNFNGSLCSSSSCFTALNESGSATSSYVNDRFDMNGKVVRLINPNYLQLNMTNLPTGTASRTISFWMANDDTSETKQVFSYGANATNQAFGFSQTNLTSTFYGGGNDLNVAYSVLQGSWNFYTFTFDGTEAKMYINGILQGTHTAASSWSTAAVTSFTIGKGISGITRSNLRMDELKVYNTALTATQIANLYIADPFSTTGLVAYYGFENNNNSHNGQNNLQNQNGTSSYTTGVIGNALECTQTTTSNALFSNTLGTQLSNPANYTICFWLKRGNQNQNFPTFIELFGSHYLRQVSTNSSLNSGYAINTTTFVGDNNIANAMTSNTYSHIAMVHGSGTSDNCVVYIDGEPAYFITGNAPNIQRFAGSIFIAGGANGNGAEQATKRFIGSIDEMYVYNRALTLPEVRGVKNNVIVPLSNQDFNTNNLKFSISPNPATDILNIEMEKEIQSLEIYSLQGQKVLADTNKNISISNISNGIYMVRVQDVDGAIATQKLIKK